ncbi:hypothetical protein PybrP1_010519 [[Pythium] brassicae (nom. inval.)]|nr:hypothetical protein PybrP1_010519 [[Pythium] brassicae (nom. inval.)]
MISFDTFTGQLHGGADNVSESSNGGSLSDLASDDTCDKSGAEAPPRRVSAAEADHDVDALAVVASDAENPYDLFHERTPTVAVATTPPQHSGGRRGRKHRKSSSGSSAPLPPPPIIIPPIDEHVRDREHERLHGPSPPTEGGGGRVLQLFHLLTFKNQAGDAKSALVQRLVAVTNVKELIMSKATEEQIASAANDAITDEILASVDMEDKRRQSVTSLLASGQLPPNSAEGRLKSALGEDASRAIVPTGHYSPYRVLELVDVLDSTTGGMVKLILTNVRSRAPFSQRSRRSKAIEFCSFCTAYSDHTAAQHRCRICGAAGQHRSKSCPKSASSPSSFTPPSRYKIPGSPASGKAYCTFCSAIVGHSTQTHQCRNCGALGAHRSRSCSQKPTGRSNRWVGSPIEQFRERKFCDLCGAWRYHTSNEHKCSMCSAVGEHRSKSCPVRAAGSSKSPGSNGTRTPRINPGGSATPTAAPLQVCAFCSKPAAHRSEEHRCRVCQVVGAHRSGECPARKPPQSVLSYSVTTATKVIEKVLPSSATSLVWNSIDKVGDVDTILKKTLQRIGVWGGGSQTPITTPYAPPVGSRESSSDSSLQLFAAPSSVALNAAGVYVLSYAEGRSVVPERILKYMRLLMHHEISVNAFSVVVRFDPRSSHWELAKPGMVTPRSLPSSPTMSEQLKKRMAKYTLQTLLGAREKLVGMALEQHKQTLQLQQADGQQAGDLEPSEVPGVSVAVNSS